MVPSFDSTTRSLAGDRSRSSLRLVAPLLLAGLWCAWMVLGELTLYEASVSARVSAQGVARLTAPVGAVVVDAPLQLGDVVEAGALIAQLDDREARLLLGAAQARVEGLTAQIAAIEAATLADAAGRLAGDAAGRAAMGAADASLAQARILAEQGRAELARLESLVAQRAASAAELESARAELAVREARVRALEEESGRGVRLLRQQSLLGEADASRGAGLLSSLRGELAAAMAEATRLENLAAERTIRAPTAGVVGELAALVPGQRVEAGALVAVIVPPGPLLVEARLPPERAVGRVAPGQAATVQLLGSAATVGARAAVVTRVGNEAGPDGLVPVNLELRTPGPERHGQVATVRIAVETLSPLSLLQRAAGQSR